MLSYLFSALRQAKAETNTPDPVASEDQLLRSLERLCRLPTAQPGQPSQPVPDDRVRRVVAILLILDNSHGRRDWSRWSDRPRTFIILWNLDAVKFMDDFAEKNYTDFYLPYDSRTLPGFLHGELLRKQFLTVQNRLLTSAKALEDLSDDSSSTKILPHVYLDGSGDEHFHSIHALGQGGFGAVDEVWSFLTLTKYARKRVARGRQSSESSRRAQAYLVQELNDLKSLSHRHLVKVFGSYTDKDYIAFLMKPVADCNLHDYLRQSGGLKEQHRHDLRKFFGCLAGAVNYLHGCKIRHRDLSAKNILICQGAVYISDLGSAHKWTSTAAQGSVTQDRNVPMNIEYIAPEIAKRAARSSSSDMWSLGVVFLEMATVLVGRTLDQLQTTIVRKAARDQRPYIWANPRVVSVWVNELQQSNNGPRHDNEPLVWIRDLLDEIPNNRPKSRGLMQDILECPSFSIFCCIACQPEFRDRSFQYDGLPVISEDTMEDSLNVQKDVASILHSEMRQPTVLSMKKASSIETWLARTEPIPDQWSSSAMPGSYSFDDPLVDNRSVAPLIATSEAPAAITSTQLQTPMTQPPPPPVPDPGMTRSVQVMLPDEPIELLADTDFYPYPPSVEPKKSSRVSDRRSMRAQDSGLGFLEYESSSSSDEGDPKLFNELDSSSESDSSSDATIHPPRASIRGIEQAVDQSAQESRPLPNFTSEDLSWIQTLNTLPDEVEEEQPLESDSAFPAAEEPEHSMSNVIELFELDSRIVEGDCSGLNQEAMHPRSLPPQQQLECVVSSESAYELFDGSQWSKDIVGTEGPTLLTIESRTESHPELATKVSGGSSGPSTPRCEVEGEASSQSSTQSPAAHDSAPRSQGPSNKRHDSTVAADLSLSSEVVSEAEAETKPRIKLQKAPTGFKGRGDKLSAANMAFLNDSLPLPQRFEPEKRVHEPGISASDYIQDTWEEASSVATSAMSERTKGILKGLSLNKWLDKDHGLLETFCARGNVQAVRVLLEKGCNPGRAVGHKQGRRIGPIINAIQGASPKHNKCVRELISHGVDVNVVSRKSGKTPLHVAIENPYFRGYEHLIRHLLEAGANTNKADFKQDRPIMKIFYGNDTGPLEDYRRRALALLLRDTETEVDFVLPGTLNTPLHLAVRRKDPYAVGMLLFKKANVNAKNASGTTPLLLTANQFQGTLTKDQITILVLLLKTDGIAIDEKGGVNEQTALHYAIRSSAPVAVELLLTHGADPRCKDSEGRDALAVAMQVAQEQAQEEHVEIMGRLCASMGKTWPRDENSCILEMACEESDGDLMRALLFDGLEPNCKKNNRPILQRGIGYGNAVVVELLTECGAFADEVNEKSQGAITYAVMKGEDEIARYLCRAGKYRTTAVRITLEELDKLIAARNLSQT